LFYKLQINTNLQIYKNTGNYICTFVYLYEICTFVGPKIMSTKKSNEVKINAKKIILQGEKAIRKNIGIAQAKGDDLQKMAMQEYDKVKKQMDATAKKVGDYIKKNPRKATLISAGIGATLGAVAGLMASGSSKKKK